MLALDAERPGPRAACLMVFLPGGGDSAQSFEKNGFVEEVLRRDYSIDMVSADATMGYYTRGIFAERLARDVVRRRVLRGYKELWLVGPSLGGFGTLLYSRKAPVREVSGVFALAPFLGTKDAVFEQIKRDGGLTHWRAPAPRPVREADFEWELWRWLKARTTDSEPGPELYLGYGEDDRLARAGSLLAAALPREHVFTGPGGHDWRTWRRLFSEFLDRGPLRERCRDSKL
jgi:pimeloyl-ACP methyl ester carboxylesterase